MRLANQAGTYLLVDPAFSLEAFQGVAYSMLLQRTGPGTGTPGVDYSEKWSDGKRVVEWLEVGKLDCSFVWFIGTDPKETAEYLSEKLGAQGLPELVRLASESHVKHDELVDLLYRVGYMAVEATEDVLTLFERAMKDPRPTMRRAALNGYMIRRWPRLRALVATLGTADPDPDVRDTARRVLDLGPA